MFTKDELKRQLAEMGLRPSDTVLAHTSLKAIGETEDGADGVIDAFREYLSDGLFIVPTHTWATVNAKNPFFDVRATEPCIGTMPRIAAKHPDAVRSAHPTHSVAAFGARARSFTAGEEHAASPCMAGGCWARLYDEDAKILLIGVTHNRNTYLHAVDEMLNIPERLSPNPIDMTIHMADGMEVTTSYRGHSCPRTNDVSQYYVNYEKPFDMLGAVTRATFGNAATRVCSARKCADIARLLWSKADYDLCIQEKDIPEEYYR